MDVDQILFVDETDVTEPLDWDIIQRNHKKLLCATVQFDIDSLLIEGKVE
jgi:hypothetical protein